MVDHRYQTSQYSLVKSAGFSVGVEVGEDVGKIVGFNVGVNVGKDVGSGEKQTLPLFKILSTGGNKSSFPPPPLPPPSLLSPHSYSSSNVLQSNMGTPYVMRLYRFALQRAALEISLMASWAFIS